MNALETAIQKTEEKLNYDGNKMTKWDMDYDGVSDNRKLTLAELDTFYWPQVFGPVDDVLSNTHHGNLPGHTDWE